MSQKYFNYILLIQRDLADFVYKIKSEFRNIGAKMKYYVYMNKPYIFVINK